MDINSSCCHLLSKDATPSRFTLYTWWVCWKYHMYLPINYASRKTPCVRTLLLSLGVQMHCNFSSRFLTESLHDLKLHSLYSETHWFECNAFVVSGTDILNINNWPQCNDCSFFEHIPCNVNDYHYAPWTKSIKQNWEFARYWNR